MNQKQFIILLVLVVVIGGIGLAVYKKNDASYRGNTRAGQKLLGDFDVNEVSHITIRQDGDELNLVKSGDVWTVKERGNYPANFAQISEFVRKIRDLKVVQTVKVGPSQRHRLNLADPGKPSGATVVEFKGAGDKIIKSFWLGAQHMRKTQQASPFGDEGFPDGRYVLTSLDSEVAAVVSDPLSNAEAKPEDWIHKEFFKVEKVKSIELQTPEATNSWKVTRESENGTWVLADTKPGENFDTSKVSGFGSALTYPSFNDVVVDKKPEETGLDKPQQLIIDTFDGLKYALNIGNKGPDNAYYMTISVSGDLPKERIAGSDEKPEDKEKLDKEFNEKQEKLREKLQREQVFGKWTYLVPSWTLDQLLKNRSELMTEKKEDEKESEAPDPVSALETPALGVDLP